MMLQELYQKPKITFVPKLWDLASLLIIFAIFALLAWGANQMSSPYQLGQKLSISLSYTALPGYAVKTVLRMFIALFFSLIFTFTVAPLAAKSRQAEKVLIPLIDILQAVPILGFLSISVVAFIQLFPNSLLGPEFAAIFAIFTSQVWNMVLSLYQSLRVVPKEFYDTASILHLSAWQKYWRIEVPHAIPSLLWNTMISMSAGWFFVVASEAISVANQQILLPGIGSYIAVAILESNMHAILAAILMMLFVILCYDQLLFRPLLTWAEKFKGGNLDETFLNRPWFYNLLTKTAWVKKFNKGLDKTTHFFIYPPSLFSRPNRASSNLNPAFAKYGVFFWNFFLIGITFAATIILIFFVLETVTWSEIFQVFYLGFLTAIKVGLLTALASLIWIPIGVWIGGNPKLIPIAQPIVQFVAAFPINLVYPIIFTLIVAYELNVNIWTAPLMILGTQWYILFNVIAGSASIPKELRLAASNFGVKGWLLWKKLLLPAIFPYYVTGAMTAAAGAWNASIVAEVLTWGDRKLIAVGLGSYISEHTSSGDFQRIALGIAVMCCYVLLINRFVWARLYERSQRHLLS